MAYGLLGHYREREPLGIGMLAGAVALLVVIPIVGLLDERDNVAPRVALAAGVAAAIGAAIMWFIAASRLMAAVVPWLANFLAVPGLGVVLLLTPQYLLLDLNGVERTCTLVTGEVNFSKSNRTGATTPVHDLTLDCPEGRFEIVGDGYAPGTGPTAQVTFDRLGIAPPELTDDMPDSTWWMWPLALLPLGLVGWHLATVPRARRATLRRLTAFEEGQPTF